MGPYSKEISPMLLPLKENDPVLQSLSSPQNNDNSNSNISTTHVADESTTITQPNHISYQSTLPHPHALRHSSTRHFSSKWWCWPTRSWCSSNRFDLDPDAFYFAVRMSILLTVSSLFVLIFHNHHEAYPSGMWVLISVLFVCWFPARDAASVVEKILQRLAGTLVGAVCGLGCGLLASVWTRPSRAVWVAVCTAVFTFGVVLLAGHVTLKTTRQKLIQRYSYATVLCLLTFAICLVPFGTSQTTTISSDDGTHQRPPWLTAVWRVVNVVVGCLLGALGSICLWPRSSGSVLLDKTARQVGLAGQASEAVLVSAARALSGQCLPVRLADMFLMDMAHQSPNNSNKRVLVAMEKYEDAIGDWKACKALFPLLQYDPLYFGKKRSDEFRNEIAKTLARALRIQTTVLVLDGMIRSDAPIRLSGPQIQVLNDTGRLLGTLLTLPLDISRSDAAAQALFRKIQDMRQWKLDPVDSSLYDNDLRDFENRLLHPAIYTSTRMDDNDGRSVPAYAQGGNEVLFLQLVEHLVLRALRLYHAWKLVELQTLADKDSSTRSVVVV